MAEQQHNLKRSYLDDKRPRVPLYPPLDDSDLLLSSPPPHTSSSVPPQPASLSTSFAELLLEDRSLLHNSRDGRLSRDSRGVYAAGLHTDGIGGGPTDDVDNLRASIMALQLQNSKLSLCLQQERERSNQYQTIINNDRKYIEKLEETVKVRYHDLGYMRHHNCIP